jgi:hypothetical protein
MRKVIVNEFMSLDGVVQAPGGVDEDTSGGSSGRTRRSSTATLTDGRDPRDVRSGRRLRRTRPTSSRAASIPWLCG